MHAERLRCAWLVDPLAVDRDDPRLTWVAVADEDGEQVTAAEVRVATPRGGWSSGEITGAVAHLDYAGPQLLPGERATWQVRLRSQDTWSSWSTAASWERGLPDESNWRGAAWISGATVPFQRPDFRPSPLLRTTTELASDIVRARAYVTALGLYELHINDRRIGDDHLTPGYTYYEKRVQYQAYDVTDALQKGSNAFGLMLGDGWYCGMLPYSATVRARGGAAPRGRLLVVVDHADGSQSTVVSDGSWRTTLGPVLHADRYLGSSYDARQQVPEWASPAYDDAGWSSVQVHDTPDGVQIVPTLVEPVRLTDEVAAVAVTEPLLPGGAFVVDFGRNVVGWTQLHAPAGAGFTVRVRHGEVLDGQGALYTANLWDTSAQTDTYYLGEHAASYEPSFTVHGFRYAEVLGYPGRVEPANLIARVAHTASRASGQFECSNPLLNTLHDNIQRTQRGNFVEVPTDCPQRLERLGWMGDAQLFSDTSWFGYDVAAFWTRWLSDVRLAQDETGAFPNVVPPEAPFPPLGAPGWGDAGVILPWLIYRVYGDERLLAQSLPSMQRWVELLEKSSPGLVYDPPHAWGDWLAVPPDQYEATRKDVLGTLYFAHSADLTAQAAEALGDEATAARHRTLFDDVRAAFDKSFVDADGRVTGETQTVYALALRFGVIADDKRAAAAAHLVADIARRGGHLSTGIVGTAHLLPALTGSGHLDVAYQLVEQTSYPSWGYSIDRGATTIWERWDGWTEERGFQTPSMNSFNHYALGAVGAWMYQTVAGISPASPGFTRARIAPQPGGSLTSASASYDSAVGTYSCFWRRDESSMRVEVNVPPAGSATVVLPDSNQEIDAVPGKHIYERPAHGAWTEIERRD